MIESTKIWTTTHRGIEIRFWQTGQHWFAVAPGQESEIQGHSTLRAALQCAFDFINDDRRVPISVPHCPVAHPDQPVAQPLRAPAPERELQLQVSAK
jgi:hypothetical protein